MAVQVQGQCVKGTMRQTTIDSPFSLPGTLLPGVVLMFFFAEVTFWPFAGKDEVHNMRSVTSVTGTEHWREETPFVGTHSLFPPKK